MPRRTYFYRSRCKLPVVQGRFIIPIKQLIEEHLPFGYRTVAGLLCFNMNTVQRIFQLKGWQVKKRPVMRQPHIQSLPSIASAPRPALVD